MEHHPAKGWQPRWKYPIDMAACGEAAAAPAWAWHEQWIKNPESFREKTPKTYNRILKSSNPGAMAMGREPLLAAREAMALTGQRVRLQGSPRTPFLVYVTSSATAGAPGTVVQMKVPREVVAEFDRVAWTLTSVFETDAYPFIARLCASYLESVGEVWRTECPGPFARLFADDEQVEEQWNLDQLSPLGRDIYVALESTGSLPEAYFSGRRGILISGAQGTPFRGGGVGANLGALFWGEDFESHFRSDAAMAAKTAAFLAVNSKARVSSFPDQSTLLPSEGQRDDNGRYVTLIANSWFTLGGMSEERIGGSYELALGFGETDISHGWIQFMKEYISRVLPLSGRAAVYDTKELQGLFQQRRLLPTVFIEESIPLLPRPEKP